MSEMYLERARRLLNHHREDVGYREGYVAMALAAILSHLEEQPSNVDLANLIQDQLTPLWQAIHTLELVERGYSREQAVTPRETENETGATFTPRSYQAIPRETPPSLPAIESTEGQPSTNDTSSSPCYLVKANDGALEFIATVTFHEPSSTPVLGPLPSALRYSSLLPIPLTTSALLSLSGSTPSNAKEVAHGEAVVGRYAGEVGHD